MSKTLQYMFVESKGQPVRIGDHLVIQGDSIPIKNGVVTLLFKEGRPKGHGIRLKAKGGWIELSDGSHVEVVYTWRSPDLPDKVTYRVSCPDGKLKICNIYRITHKNGVITEDMWTGNAGMVLVSEQPNKRIYGCSPGGSGEFNPSDLIVQVEWSEI